MRKKVLLQLSKHFHKLYHNQAAVLSEESSREIVNSEIKKIYDHLIDENVPAAVIEGVLYYFWLAMTAVISNSCNQFFEKWFTEFDGKMSDTKELIKVQITQMEKSSPSHVPREEILKIQNSYYHNNLINFLSGEFALPFVIKTEDCFYSTICELMERKIQPEIIESGLVYYWFQASVLGLNFDERIMEKLENNWPEIMAYIKHVKEKWD